ncbi:MAG: type II toxin-antitoxin system RelE/ParE family toxin [Xanthomonadaceae bacterium]|nr:type II toxin-antitoxin system RelE/ParE family toxin [Xanthomonadaceae bacterium]MDP2184546.1 type II toxin-antitoxin system RelE/ParE family toxin [Xanthomonadales bacterium]MDZ4115069.1 type II toxin-antitoxin system RelE/ParE family toxin [Xanthomonadaceae bacterium]MDZ4377509.1 type II toxin-antitoxin system RelE/ParE family toxin [Xanthomonadaceae bacterium]
MPRLIWSPPALLDVARLHRYLASKNRAATIRAIKSLRQGVKLLEQHPEAGRPAEGHPTEFREWPMDFGNSGYVALYRLDGQRVVILAVRHAREFDY